MVAGDEPTQAGKERRFPENPWAALHAEAPAVDDPWLRAAAAAALLRAGPPCDLALGRAHLKAHLPSGEYWLYACSTHSQAILDILENDPTVRFAGFVDANAVAIGGFLGHPVITPEELAGRSFDGVLVGHLRYEDTFVETLLAHGIEQEKIVRVYGNETYWKAAVADYVARIAAMHPGPYNTIIVTNNSVVISDHELLAFFEYNKTLVVYYGSSSQYEETCFPVVDAKESLDLLYNILGFYSPKNIYIRTMFDTGCAVYSIRNKFKNSFIIHEMFDLSIVFPDAQLIRWNKWNEDIIKTLRHAEWNSFQTSDFIISKRGGRCWEKILSPFNTQYATVFSRVSIPDEEPVVPSSEGPIQIAYAGYLSPEARHLGGYYDLYPCFENLIASTNAVIDIYNAGHLPTVHHDEAYRHYVMRDYGGRINYHRAKPYDDLLHALPAYHFGWLCNERSDIYIHDAAVTIPGRLTGYISAGVPVILDDEFEFLAGLIDSFGAGIVVPGGRTDLIPDLIRRADHTALRAGARRLRAHMFARNQEAFHRLRSLMRDRETPLRVGTTQGAS